MSDYKLRFIEHPNRLMDLNNRLRKQLWAEFERLTGQESNPWVDYEWIRIIEKSLKEAETPPKIHEFPDRRRK